MNERKSVGDGIFAVVLILYAVNEHTQHMHIVMGVCVCLNIFIVCVSVDEL